MYTTYLAFKWDSKKEINSYQSPQISAKMLMHKLDYFSLNTCSCRKILVGALQCAEYIPFQGQILLLIPEIKASHKNRFMDILHTFGVKNENGSPDYVSFM